jgi:centrosomal protein CEP78
MLTELCSCTTDNAHFTNSFQYQNIQRYSDRWRHTLRDQEPNLDCLPGVRRVSLNHNIDIGDVGAAHLMDVLRDDIFLTGEKCMLPCD